jgi:murein DD-endopeptidase MepM/ murein hydrolase activator NlpD
MTIIPTAFAQEGIIKAVSDFIPGGVENIFNLGLGVGAILALGTIIYAGILYTTAGDSESKQKDAKEWILSAAKGLGLIAFGWILLNIVNPNITKIKEIEIPKLEYNDLSPIEYYTPYNSMSSAGIINPIGSNAIIGSVYGMRFHPIDKVCKPHRGIDIDTASGNTDCGTPILAAKDGIVTKHPDTGGYGLYATVQHDNGTISYYAHLEGFPSSINSGDEVKQGQVIGYMGNTGASTACHLHFEIKKKNPASGNWEAININPIFGVENKRPAQEAPCL